MNNGMIQRMLRLLSIGTVFLFLLSCATSQSPLDGGDAVSQESIKQGLFDAWHDSSLSNIAVAGLIKQADKMIDYKQWDDAQAKLERSLRVSSNYAPAWSRLSWLSLRAAKLKKSIQLAHRSNSYTDVRALKILNWSFIRDAHQLMGDDEQEMAAINMLNRLREIHYEN